MTATTPKPHPGSPYEPLTTHTHHNTPTTPISFLYVHPPHSRTRAENSDLVVMTPWVLQERGSRLHSLAGELLSNLPKFLCPGVCCSPSNKQGTRSKQNDASRRTLVEETTPPFTHANTRHSYCVTCTPLLPYTHSIQSRPSQSEQVPGCIFP